MYIKLKKFLITLPVLLLTFFFLTEYYEKEYSHTGTTRLLLFFFTVIILYIWIIHFITNRPQSTFWQLLIQSSFFVYVFMVLTLTGYFILFREISYHDWWQKMLHRIEKRDHVNLHLFKIFSIYRITDRQIAGNLIMLFPLGIYLPLLYKRFSGFLQVALLSLLVSITIELLQLATSYRSADIDDILLNTFGACAGFVFYKTMTGLFKISVSFNKNSNI